LFTPHIIRAENNDSTMVKILLIEQRVMMASDDTIKAIALMSKANLYKELNQYVEAAATLNRINVEAISSSLADEYYYQRAFSLFMVGAHSEALLEFLNIKSNKNLNEELKLLYLMLLLENQRWDDFKNEYQNLASKDGTDSLLFKKEFATPVLLEPDRYAKLSAQMPGLGMMKSGYFGRGLTSLGLQLFFVGFGVYNISLTYYFTGVFSGLMPARKFYLGGKLLTHSLVEKKNQREINDSKRKGYELISHLFKY